jgi:hypothetical protein
MISQPTVRGAVAREHLRDLRRAADVARGLPELPRRHRTPRRRPAWWIRVTTRRAGPRAVPAAP